MDLGPVIAMNWANSLNKICLNPRNHYMNMLKDDAKEGMISPCRREFERIVL